MKANAVLFFFWVFAFANKQISVLLAARLCCPQVDKKLVAVGFGWCFTFFVSFCSFVWSTHTQKKTKHYLITDLKIAIGCQVIGPKEKDEFACQQAHAKANKKKFIKFREKAKQCTELKFI